MFVTISKVNNYFDTIDTFRVNISRKNVYLW